jgi:type I restriction enzyme S subunit
MNSKTFFDNFETIANAPGGIARLRELILDLAVSGQLLPQLHEDENSHQLAVDLLKNREKSLVEKSLAIKPLASPDFQNSLFNIPSTWVWVSLGLFCHPQAGFAFKSSQFNTDGRGTPLIRIRDIGSEVTQCHFEGEFRSEFVVQKGDWLIGMDGNFNVRQWSGPDALLNQRVTRLIFLDERIEQRFVAWALQKQVYALMGTKSYTTVDHLSTKQINESLIPLPPYAEQKSIVAKVDELMTLCDELEATQNLRDSIRTSARKSAIDAISSASSTEELDVAWKRISSNWTTIAEAPETVDSLKMVILDLAVRGRLVPHENSDDSAIELVNKSISGGKNKSVSEQLTPSKSLFEIPDHWVWASVASMCDTQTGTTPKVLGEDESDSERIQYVTAADMINFRAVENNFVPLTTAKRAGRLVTENSVLFVGIGATIGKTCLLNSPATFNQQIHAATPRKMNAEYLSLVLASGYFQQICRDRTNATAIPILNKSKWEAIGIPIPPLKEQVRISERCSELFALCDELEFSLIKRDELAKKIAASLTNQAAA